MKKLLLLLFSAIISCTILGQDVIYKHNGDEINSKVLEITSETIKYKDFDFQDGPVRNINIKDVFMIIYENGVREKFTVKKNETSNENPVLENQYSKENTEYSYEESGHPEKSTNKNFDGNHFTIGTGYGNSYGGAGLRFQWRTGGNVGFGIHAGVGYFPNAPVLASGGLKFFPYKGIYINAQFGLTGWEEYYEYYHYWNGQYEEFYYNYDSHILFGPSFLTGVDWTWGDKVGFGFNAGVGFTYNINVEHFSPVTLAIDIGFLIRF